ESRPPSHMTDSMIPILGTWFRIGIALTLVAASGILQSRATDEMYPDTGMPANHVFDVQGFDSIDVLNGNMHFEKVLYSPTIDSGFRYEVKLAYNSSVWNWHSNENQMRLGSTSSVGVGFRLHMGRIYEITVVNATNKWFYEDSSGTSHELKGAN